MECTVNWMPALGMGFVAETGSGHLLAMSGAAEGGGRDLAPRPMETVLAGAGGCTAYDVVMILQRGRHEVHGCQVRLSAERADREPKVFTRIHMLRRQRSRPARRGRRTGDRALPRALLLGQHHARQDGGDHHEPRARRRLSEPACAPSRQLAGTASVTKRVTMFALTDKCLVRFMTKSTVQAPASGSHGPGHTHPRPWLVVVRQQRTA